MNKTAQSLEATLKKHSNKEKVELFMRFFKTGPGQYGEGDLFLGLTVPQQRLIAKEYFDLPLAELSKSIRSPFHEMRLTSLIIATLQFEKALKKNDLDLAQKIINFYLANTSHINNWDLVDASAPRLLGQWLFTRDRQILHQFSRSESLWEKRIAIISTLFFIKKKDFTDTLVIAERLMSDPHDLIHKAIGWMLREVGKMHRPTLNRFLQKQAHHLPRTALRYAIEHYPETIRKKYLAQIS